MNLNDPHYKKAKLGAILMLFGMMVMMVAVIFIGPTYIESPLYLDTILPISGIVVSMVGLTIFYINMQKYLNKEASKNVGKVNSFVQKWKSKQKKW